MYFITQLPLLYAWMVNCGVLVFVLPVNVAIVCHSAQAQVLRAQIPVGQPDDTVGISGGHVGQVGLREALQPCEIIIDPHGAAPSLNFYLEQHLVINRADPLLRCLAVSETLGCLGQ
jgi:hypothetical protein